MQTEFYKKYSIYGAIIASIVIILNLVFLFHLLTVAPNNNGQDGAMIFILIPAILLFLPSLILTLMGLKTAYKEISKITLLSYLAIIILTIVVSNIKWH